MRTEAEQAMQDNEVEKNFTSLSFRSKRQGGPDNELIALSNRFAEQGENDGVLPTTSCRNLFRRALRIVTLTATDEDINYFMRYIERLRDNTRQLAGG